MATTLDPCQRNTRFILCKHPPATLPGTSASRPGSQRLRASALEEALLPQRRAPRGASKWRAPPGCLGRKGEGREGEGRGGRLFSPIVTGADHHPHVFYCRRRRRRPPVPRLHAARASAGAPAWRRPAQRRPAVARTGQPAARANAGSPAAGNPSSATASAWSAAALAPAQAPAERLLSVAGAQRVRAS